MAGSGEGRFVQSIKTYLASAAFRETRLFARRFTIEDLVATFLSHLAGDGGTDPRRFAGATMVAGRPVVFAGERPDEGLAVERLTAAYRLAGFPGVDFAYEPLGAAYWYARTLKSNETVLVADFGGGTSDFSVIRFVRGPHGLTAEPLGHAGVGVAGDTFDYRLVDRLVAPQLGKGSLYRSFDKRLPFPAYVHAAFAQWHQLSWLKTPQTMRELRTLASASEAPDAIEKLIAFLDLDLGFELYQAVGALKARLSVAETGRAGLLQPRHRTCGPRVPGGIRELYRRRSCPHHERDGSGAGRGGPRRRRDRCGVSDGGNVARAGGAPHLRRALRSRPAAQRKCVSVRRIRPRAAGSRPGARQGARAG